jgi:D-glycerate 3-kinase
VYFWCQKQLTAHRATGSKSPLVIGISAPQGCGKSTLCEQLEALFTSSGLTAASVSIDDFYLTYDGQQAVAQTYSTNPLLQMRGNAGSHDLDLGAETLQALRAATSAKDSVKLPRYEKSAYQGQGDRAASGTWPSVSGPVDIVLFEGWMLGFAPVEESQAASVDQNLIPVNAFLQAYKSAWDSAVDSWLVVKVKDPEYAYKWRLQAERAMRAAGKPAMTDEQVAQFVDRFMPAYKCYLTGLYKDGPTTAAKGQVLVVEVDENREPISQQPNPIM